MQYKRMQQEIRKKSSSLSFKYGALFLFFIVSIVISACGTTASTAGVSTDPQPPTSINLNKPSLTPTPALAPQWCGIWITNASPAYSTSSVIPLYAKFTLRDKDGNPAGIDQASVVFHIQWGDLGSEDVYGQTTADGLAVSSVRMSGHSLGINRLSLVTADFQSGSVTCKVGEDRPASFTMVPALAAAPTAKATPGGRPRSGGGGKLP